AALFCTCLVDQFLPEVGEATVRVLKRLGVELEFPQQQTCCGQPLFNNGFHTEAIRLARRTIPIFEGYDYVVIPSGACGLLLMVVYPERLSLEKACSVWARAFSQKVFELSQFLVGVLGMRDVGSGLKGTVTYHDSCHLLRGLKVGEEPRQLLSAIPGVELREMEDPENCCGFGGSFAAKLPEVSGAMLDVKLASAQSTGADYLVACDAGCLLQIGGGLARREGSPKPLHLAQALAWRD
ncbi:MAG: (Fe-S)-binding protein, partial [Nitrospinota bacterium]